METTFSYEATIERARAMAKAKAAGQALPPLPIAKRGKQSRSGFDLDTALRLAKENGGQRLVSDEFEV